MKCMYIYLPKTYLHTDFHESQHSEFFMLIRFKCWHNKKNIEITSEVDSASHFAELLDHGCRTSVSFLQGRSLKDHYEELQLKHAW